AAALRVAGQWKIEAVRPQLLALAQAKETSAPVRQAALDGLVLLGGPETRQALIEMAGAETPLSVRRGAVIALAAVDAAEAAKHGVELLAANPPAADIQAVVRALAEQKKGVAVFADALRDQKLPPDVAKLALRALTGNNV